MFFFGTLLAAIGLKNIILALAAILPAVFLMIKVYRADRLEKEPIGFLFRLAVAGIISTAIAVFAEYIGGFIIEAIGFESKTVSNFVLYFAVVGLSEEWAKFYLLKKRTFFSPNFNCQFDGVVYSVFVSLGFALWENIHYVFSYGLSTALVRAVTAVPGHACFGVFMGIFYGAAKKYWNTGEEKRAKSNLKKAVIIPALIHGCYDFIATLEGEMSTLIFLAFVILMLAISFRLVKKASELDSRIVQETSIVCDRYGRPVYADPMFIYNTQKNDK
ncbi:MAG: PrsW family intramembrane metalloprotease [Clostridiales bacterium]|nr:PrsW family intramembrane metalloprotease [Clostridiales bacterium]